MRHLGKPQVATIAAQARAFCQRLPADSPDVTQVQPALADLVRAETRDLGPAVTALGLTLVQWVRVTLDGASAHARRVDSAHVRDVFSQISTVLYNLDGADPALVERALDPVHAPQPELMQSLEDMLLDHQSDGRPLDNAELGVLYAIARTAVAVLHDAYQGRRAADQPNN